MKIFFFFICLLLFFGAKAQFNGKMGYAYSPSNFPDNSSSTDVTNFYDEVTATLPCGAIIIWNGLWYDQPSAIGQVPVAAMVNSAISPSPYNYEEINAFTFFHYPNLVWLNTISQPLPNNFSNTSVRDSFLLMLKTHAIQHQPKNVFIGNEVSFYLTMDSSDYSNFSSFYSMAYDTVKFYSPATNVGTVYNYEHLSGKGLYTGWTTPHWNALSDMDTSKMDMIGITLYPFFNYLDADLIPASYLDVLAQHTGNKKIVITETGWPADSTFAPAPWACSPAQQVVYANALFDSIMPGKNIKSVNWLFLNYLMSDVNDGYKICRSIAMKDSLGNSRPVKAIWESKCASVGVYSEEISDNYKVYPNPASAKIFVDGLQIGQKYSFTITDISGRIIQQLKPEAENNEINLSTFESGIYFIHIVDADHTTSFKIVVGRD